ncbi:MAG: hypothetical protein FWC86_06285, partial [Coriobacteriia bacterium]|nr:hypothetical protein [Coriobacteriia bacterium]
MTLSVLTGSIKADKLSRAISLLSSDEDEILVLCATSAQEGDIGRSFALELDYDNQNSQSNPVRVPDLQVQSFASFAADLWNKWGDGRSLVGSAIRTKVVNQTLSHSEVPAALKTSGGKVLFANIAAFFVPGNKAGLATESKKHLGIMKQHLVRYHQELENDGYIEHQFAIKLLAQTLTEEAIDFGRKKIVVVGFRDFTSAQLALLCACAKHITDSSDAEVVTENLPDRGVIITLDWEEGNPASNYTGNTLTQLLECGAQTIDVASLGSSDRYGQASQEESLEIVRGMAQGHAAEVALMADFAQEVHQEFPHEAKALLIPRPQDYLRPLAYELERRNVPFELDIKTTFGATSFGAALLALLRICVDEEAQINGLTFAMSAYSGLKPDEVLELDTRWRRYRTGPAGILAQLTKHESGACEDLRLIRARDMSAHIGDWSSLISRLYAKGLQLQSGSNFDLLQDAAAQKSTTTALQELYEEKFAHFTRQSGGGSRVVATSTPEAIITDATSLADAEQIDESADELDPIMQPGTRILSFDPRISAADLYASLREAFIAQTPNPASPAVLLAQPSRVYGRQFHSVIIGGLSAEDEIERTDSPLDVRLTASLTGSHLPDLSQQQQFNHYAVSALARKRLYLVAQTRTLAGEELKPGALWTALKQGGGATFGDSPCFEKKNDEVIAGQSFANPEKQAEIVELLQHGQTPPVLRQPSRGEELQFDLGYGEGTPVSATTLHKFANCSYNWLLHSYAAGKDIDYGFNAREQGIFAHQV